MLNLPKKLVSSVHVLVAFVLIIVALIGSFMPIVTLKVDVNNETAMEAITDVWNEISKDKLKKSDFKEPVNISAPKLLSMAGIIVELVNDPEDAADAVEDLDKETLLAALAFIGTFAAAVDVDALEDADEDSIITVIFTIVLTYVCLVYVLIATLIIPIIFLFMALFALMSVLRNAKDLSGAVNGVGKKLPGRMSIPLTIMLYQCVLPTMGIGAGTKLIFAMALAAVALNVLATRTHSYNSDEFKYLNVVQGASLLGIIGYVIFFFNIIDTNIISTFISGDWIVYVTRVAIDSAAGKSVSDYGFIVDGVMMLIYVSLVLGSVKYFNKCLRRISCTLCSAKREEDPKDCFIVKAVFMLFIYILPTIVAGHENGLSSVTKSIKNGGNKPSLDLGDAQGALTAAFVGLIIILVAEIGLAVLKKVFCEDVHTESKVAVMSGTAHGKMEAKAAEVTEEA